MKFKTRREWMKVGTLIGYIIGMIFGFIIVLAAIFDVVER